MATQTTTATATITIAPIQVQIPMPQQAPQVPHVLHVIPNNSTVQNFVHVDGLRIDGVVHTMKCEYSREGIGATVVQNICTNQETVIAWGLATWLMAIIGMIAAGTFVCIVAGRCWKFIANKGGDDDVNNDDVTYSEIVEDDDDDDDDEGHHEGNQSQSQGSRHEQR